VSRQARKCTMPLLSSTHALPLTVSSSPTISPLSRVYLPRPWRLCYRAFRDRQPVADLGHSIRVYWVEQWPEPPAPNVVDSGYLAALRKSRRLADPPAFVQSRVPALPPNERRFTVGAQSR
jgi:hypothetical protein